MPLGVRMWGGGVDDDIIEKPLSVYFWGEGGGGGGVPWCTGRDPRKVLFVNTSLLPDESYAAPQDGRQRGWSHRQHIFLCLIESIPTFICLQCYQGNVLYMCACK